MRRDFDPQKFIDDAILKIRHEVGNQKAVVALSGGVDSSVTAELGHRALGNNLIAVFLDDGLMREGEPESVVRIFRERGLNVQLRDVREIFLNALKGIVNPEDKRKAFRATFYKVLADILKEVGAKFLLQGTIAADVVETVKGVKTQHNVLSQIGIDPIKEYGYKVIEPLSSLYKHQVRMVAEALKLPRAIVERRPFPGPGLSVRVIGEVTAERLEIVRRATKIVEEETSHISCFQAFAVLMQDKATGLSQDGGRKYGEIIVVRIVDSTDAMTAEPSRISWDILERISRRITEAIPSVTRVLYDITSKPPATIEFE
ncbi:MAG: glutamine-hydrolyzing GMP synthase [Nitrososphaerota archaeon]|nr:glutamine-hydrolyzing GMP synthase [Nitrososphaerales archaeon]MDW8045342.1 glutamine-hydrolyzing GMP synthase [Nitrososphaerota archaeon]